MDTLPAFDPTTIPEEALTFLHSLHGRSILVRVLTDRNLVLSKEVVQLRSDNDLLRTQLTELALRIETLTEAQRAATKPNPTSAAASRVLRDPKATKELKSQAAAALTQPSPARTERKVK